MGTKADFYIGRGVHAAWLGSIAYDGSPWFHVCQPIMAATDSDAYLAAIELILRRGAREPICPSAGWPWPWKTSAGSDYAYTFDAGTVWVSDGCSWVSGEAYLMGARGVPDGGVFPDMTRNQRVDPRFGPLLLGRFW